jgi:hypothetical protein
MPSYRPFNKRDKLLNRVLVERPSSRELDEKICNQVFNEKDPELLGHGQLAEGSVDRAPEIIEIRQKL